VLLFYLERKTELRLKQLQIIGKVQLRF